MIAAGAAQVITGVTAAMTSTPTAAISRSATAADRTSVSSLTRRLHAAPMPVPSSSENIVTVSEYTAGEDFAEAALVVSSLGEIGGEVTKVLENRTRARPGDWVTLEDLQACMGKTR